MHCPAPRERPIIEQGEKVSRTDGLGGLVAHANPERTGQLAHHAFRADPRAAVVPERDAVRPFGKARTVRSHDQGDVRVPGWTTSQCSREQDLACGGAQEIGAPHHVRDSHREVVDYDRKLIRIDAVGTTQNEVARHTRHLFRETALEPVVCRDDAVLWHPKTHRWWALVGTAIRCATARSRVDRPLLARVRSTGRTPDLGAGAVTEIRLSSALEPLESLAIERGSLGLPVGSPRPAHVGPFVPIEAEPAQVVELLALASRPYPRGIEIFHAYHEPAARRASFQPRQERAGGRSEMQVPRGRWRKPTSVHPLYFRSTAT